MHVGEYTTMAMLTGLSVCLLMAAAQHTSHKRGWAGPRGVGGGRTIPAASICRETHLAFVGIAIHCPQPGGFICRGGDHEILVAQELGICHPLGVPTQLAQLALL